MISNLIIGAVIELLGALFMVYHLSQASLDGFASHWPWALMGSVVMIAGMLLLYAAFRPVVM